MKLKACKCFAVLLIVVVSSFGQKQSKSTTWKVDNFDKIGGQEVTVSGHPQIIEAPGVHTPRAEQLRAPTKIVIGAGDAPRRSQAGPEKARAE